MSSKIVVAFALTTFVMTGCGGVDPVSAPGEDSSAAEGNSQPVGIAVGEPHPDAFVNFRDWLQTDLAADLDLNGSITEDDFRLFLAAYSPILEPGDEPAAAPSGSVTSDTAVSPALFVTGDREEAERLADFRDDADLQATVETIDFDDNWLVVAFRGQVSTAGYGIAVEDVEYDGRSVRVRISLSDPLPGEMVAQVISSPFAAIVIPRQAVPVEKPTTWLMSTGNGSIQAKTRYPYDVGTTS